MNNLFNQVLKMTGMTSSSQGDEIAKKKTICLFDVDGTLTKPRNRITPDLDEVLEKLKGKVDVGLVGGSDLVKIAEQMGSHHGAQADLLQRFPFVFAENGLVTHIHGIRQVNETILSYMQEDGIQSLINFCLRYMSDLTLPCKRGNFIEFRTGLINICPIGRSCTQSERDVFAAFDREHKVREKFVEALKARFGQECKLTFSIGGEISIDIFPRGWDKTYCLQYLKDYEQIYFFGDKTFPGGNDYEIYSDARTTGYTVASPEETKRIITQIFLG